MDEIKRYDFDLEFDYKPDLKQERRLAEMCGCKLTEYETEEGDYCKYSDVALIIAERDAAIKYKNEIIAEGLVRVEKIIERLDAAKACMDILANERNEWKARAEKAEAEAVELEKDCNQYHANRDLLVIELDRLRELLIEANRCLKEAKRRWAANTTNSDADVIMTKIDAALAEVKG